MYTFKNKHNHNWKDWIHINIMSTEQYTIVCNQVLKCTLLIYKSYANSELRKNIMKQDDHRSP